MNQVVSQADKESGSSVWKSVALWLLGIAVSVGLSIWIVTAYLFPKEFKPVTLSQAEQQQLDRKLQRLDTLQPTHKEKPELEALTPEPYSDDEYGRDIRLTERELNALLANNTDLASRLAIDLSDNLASAKLLVPLDPELPILGGKTLRIHSGLEMRMENGKPVIILKGVSVWGVSLPNAWIGNMKNIDLASEYGDRRGFWKSFSEGVEEIEVKEGSLRIRLKE